MVKNKWILSLFIISMVVIQIGCQNRPCREIQAEKMAQKNAQNPQNNQAPGAVAAGAQTPTTNPAVVSAGELKVKVYKPDGSLQCGMGAKISLDTMEKDLKGIKVFNRYNMNDGLMRIQVCGAPTGQSNVYEISRNDLDKALKAGFKEWTQE